MARAARPRATQLRSRVRSTRLDSLDSVIAMKRFSRPFAPLVVMLIASPAAAAAQDPQPLPSPLTLADVVRLAGERRDEIQAARARTRAGQARPDIVGPWVNPKTDFHQNGPNNDTGTIYGWPSPYAPFDDPQGFSRCGATDSMGFNLQDS